MSMTTKTATDALCCRSPNGTTIVTRLVILVLPVLGFIVSDPALGEPPLGFVRFLAKDFKRVGV
jgi:hypothetical protein